MYPDHYTESQHRRALTRLWSDILRSEEENQALVEAHLEHGWRLIEPPEEKQ